MSQQQNELTMKKKDPPFEHHDNGDLWIWESHIPEVYRDGLVLLLRTQLGSGIKNITFKGTCDDPVDQDGVSSGSTCLRQGLVGQNKILQSLTFDCVNYEANPGEFSNLVATLQHGLKIKEIKFEDCYFVFEDPQAITRNFRPFAQAIRVQEELQDFAMINGENNFENCMLSVENTQQLILALRMGCLKLKGLHLVDCRVEGPSLQELIALLRSPHCQLQTLELLPTEAHFRDDGHDRRMFMNVIESNTLLVNVYITANQGNRSAELDALVDRVVQCNRMIRKIRDAGWSKSMWTIVL